MIRRLMEKALKDSGCDNRELSILITGDAQIRELNRQYLKRDNPTNVLAFPAAGESGGIETGMLGDIVISVDTANREAFKMGIPYHERICQLLIHGLLHLLGYDHEKSKRDEKIMQKEEQRLLSLLLEN